MTWRSRFGLGLAPVFLRLALASVFLYAGAGKLFYSMPVSGDAAGRLVSLGLAEPPAPKAVEPPPRDIVVPTEPSDRVPEAEPVAPDPLPESPATEGSPAEPQSDPELNTSRSLAQVDSPSEQPPPAITPEPVAPSKSSAPPVTVELPIEAEESASIPFVGEIVVSRRLGLVLTMDDAHDRGQWPAALSTAGALDGLAWAAALIEFIGGWLMLLGLMTRIWALGLAGVMAGALWLTQLGPAMASGAAFLWVLPAWEMDDPARWTSAWQPMFFQFTLMCTALAVTLLGAGWPSLDALLFGSHRHDAIAASHRMRSGSRPPATMAK